MRQRPPIGRPPESRRFTDRALADLRAEHYSPGGWARFFVRCGARSFEQIRLRPRAAVEVTAVHIALAPVAWRRPVVLVISWLLAMTHLGLLGAGRDSIGIANCLSLFRANLPLTRTAPLLAMTSDLADGWIARRTRPTAFGGYADGLADLTFWTRFATQRSGRLLGGLALAGWLSPAIAIIIGYFVRGAVIDHPRPMWTRWLSAALECVIAAEALRPLAGREEVEWKPSSRASKRMPTTSSSN